MVGGELTWRLQLTGFAKDELFIKFKSGVSVQSVHSFVNENNLEMIREISPIKVIVFNIRGEQNIISFCKELNEDPLVEYAEPNFVVHENSVLSDHNK